MKNVEICKLGNDGVGAALVDALKKIRSLSLSKGIDETGP